MQCLVVCGFIYNLVVGKGKVLRQRLAGMPFLEQALAQRSQRCSLPQPEESFLGQPRAGLKWKSNITGNFMAPGRHGVFLASRQVVTIYRSNSLPCTLCPGHPPVRANYS